MLRIIFTGFGLLLLGMTGAGAQEPLIACQEQSELEQVRASNGDIMPDSCREVSVSVLEGDGERLCLVDFTGAGEGFIDQLREAAVSERWWMSCDDLGAAAR